MEEQGLWNIVKYQMAQPGADMQSLRRNVCNECSAAQQRRSWSEHIIGVVKNEKRKKNSERRV